MEKRRYTGDSFEGKRTGVSTRGLAIEGSGSNSLSQSTHSSVATHEANSFSRDCKGVIVVRGGFMLNGMVRVAVFVAAAAAVTTAFAAEQISIGGVRGGSVRVLTRDPANATSLVMGVTGGGLFVSSSNGATWGARFLPEIAEHTVSGVLVEADGTESVCGDPGGLGLSPMLYSPDHGATWTRVAFDAPYANCVVLARGKDAGTLFAGIETGAANNPNPSTYGGKLYRSTDGGQTWTATALALTGELPSAIVQLASGRIVLGRQQIPPQGQFTSNAGGLQYSDDSGATWQQVPSITGATVGLGQNSGGMLVGVFLDSSNHGLIETSPDGATWTLSATINPPGGPAVGAVVYHASSDTFFALAAEQVFRSTPGPGYSFSGATDIAASASTPVAYSLFHHSTIDVDPADANRILVADLGGDGLVITTNGGTTWKFSNDGFNAQSIDHAVKHPPTGYRYATNGLGYVYFSAGDFGTFKKIFRASGGGGGFEPVYGVAFDRNNPARVMIANERQSDFTPLLRILPDAVSAPEDDPPFSHASWTSITPPTVASTTIGAMLVDGSNLTVGMAPFNVPAASGQFLYRSTNTGTSWAPLALTTIGGIRALAWGASTSEIYAGAGDAGSQGSGGPAGGNGLFKSTDGGTTWNPLASNAALAAEAVVRIAVDPANSMRVWILTQVPGVPGGAAPVHIYETLDGGMTISTITPDNFSNGGANGESANAFDLAYVAVEDKVIIATGGAINGYMYVPASGDRHWLAAFSVYGDARTLYSGSVGVGGGGGLFEVTGLGIPDIGGGGKKKSGCGCDLTGSGMTLGVILSLSPLLGGLAVLRRRRRN